GVAHEGLAAAPGPPADVPRDHARVAPSPARDAGPCGTPPSTPSAPRPSDDLRGTAYRRPHTTSPELPTNPSRKPGRHRQLHGEDVTPPTDTAAPGCGPEGGSVLVSRGGSILVSGEDRTRARGTAFSLAGRVLLARLLGCSLGLVVT